MPCPVKNCDKNVRVGQLLCLGHWHSLPQKLKNDVNRTWRNYRKDPGAYTEARAAAIAHCESAVDPAAQANLFT